MNRQVVHEKLVERAPIAELGQRLFIVEVGIEIAGIPGPDAEAVEHPGAEGEMVLLPLCQVEMLPLSESIQKRVPILSADSQLHQPGVMVDAGCSHTNLFLGHAE